jgi:Transposase
MEHTVHRKALANRRRPLADIGNDIEPPISRKSVAKVLDGYGLHRRVGRKVPFLKKAQKRARLAWAREMRNMNEEGWMDVIWSDESYVHLDDKNGRIYVTCTADKEFKDECLILTFKQSNIWLMVWGCIAHGWKGPLVILEYPGGKGGGMTAQQYQEQVLDGVLEDSLREIRAKRPGIRFQQDGASCHKAKSTHRWFSDRKIPLFPHPADLSPIEPVWHELKKRIREHRPIPTTFESLKKVVMEEWENLDVADINRHTSKMIERVDAVRKAKGGHTKF